MMMGEHMKRSAFVIIYSLLLCSSMYGQSGWNLVSSGTTRHLYDLEKVSIFNNTFVIVGEGGVMLSSVDGGITWDSIASGIATTIRSVQFPFPDTAYACGDSGMILRSNDGGRSWNRMDSPTSANLSRLVFPSGRIVPNSRTAWIAGDSGIVLRTTNRGGPWTKLRSPGVATFRSLFFSNFINLWLTGDSGKIYRSSNVGSSWTLISGAPATTQFHAISFVSRDSGWAVGSEGTIVRINQSSSGEATLRLQESPVRSTLRACAFYRDGTGYAVGDSGVIIKTTDFGNRWDRLESGTQATLHDVYFVNKNTVLAIGENGTILRTVSGGKYEPVFVAENPRFDFGSVEIGTTRSVRIEITNGGIAPLNISDIQSTVAQFSASPTTAVIPPESSMTFTISFTPAWDSLISGKMRFIDGTFPESHEVVVTGSGAHRNVAPPWRWIGSPAGGNSITDGEFIAPGVMVMVGEEGLIRKTRDRGLNWKNDRNAGGKHSTLLAVECFDSLNAIAVGEYGAVVVTEDGGEHWESRESGTTAVLTDISYIDRDNVMAVGWYYLGDRAYFTPGAGIMIRSSDGGRSWMKVWQGSERTYSEEDIVSVSRVDFFDASFGIVTGGRRSYQKIPVALRTTDGGLHWEEHQMDDEGEVHAIKCIGGERAVAASTEGLYLSTDGGRAWSLIRGNDFRSLSFARGGMIGMAAGLGGGLVRTTDGGSRWNAVHVASETSFPVVMVEDEDNAIVVKTIFLAEGIPRRYLKNELFSTSDGGITWQSLSLGKSLGSVQGISFRSREQGIIAGYGGTLSVTSDGGKSWDYPLEGSLLEAAGVSLSSVDYADNFNVTVVGANGTILRSSDGGARWSTLAAPTEKDFFDIRYFDSQVGYMVGTSGTVFMTTNGGGTWTDRSLRTSSDLMKIEVHSRLSATAVGNYGLIIKTTDGGMSWEVQRDGGRERINGVWFTDSARGFAVGEKGLILKTIDGGNHWTAHATGSAATLRSIAFVDERVGMIVGEDVILESSDGGETWRGTVGGTGSLFGITIVDSGMAIAAGTYGLVRWEKGTALTVEDGWRVLPNAFALSQNYPNPFNPNTTIRFRLPGGATGESLVRRVELKIFDVLGREVATLVDEEMGAGEYSATWDGHAATGQAPSGVYIYRLTAGEFVATSKMVLVK